MSVFKYLFYVVYKFYLNVFKERDYTWFFASAVLSLIVTFTLIDVLQIIQYARLPAKTNFYGDYHAYFSLLMCGASAGFFKTNDRYIQILTSVEKWTKKKRKIVSIVAGVYAGTVVFLFFYLSILIVEYR